MTLLQFAICFATAVIVFGLAVLVLDRREARGRRRTLIRVPPYRITSVPLPPIDGRERRLRLYRRR